MHDNDNSSQTPFSGVSVFSQAAQQAARQSGKQPESQVDTAVIWLHGLGADGNDFVPVVPMLQRCANLRIQFLFPHAPEQAVTINGGMRMRAWYDIRSIDLTGKRELDASGIAGSVQAINAMIDAQLQRGIDRQRIVLAGFSQGGVIALQAGLQQQQALAGVVGLSSYLPAHESLPDWFSAAESHPPVFIGHGNQDPMVPFAQGQQAAEQIAAAGWQVQWQQYPVAHGLHPQEIADLDSWLAGQLE